METRPIRWLNCNQIVLFKKHAEYCFLAQMIYLTNMPINSHISLFLRAKYEFYSKNSILIAANCCTVPNSGLQQFYIHS